MSTSENGSLGLTKKSILERLDTLIELNKKIYEATLVDKFASVVAEVEAKRISTETSLKEYANNVAKVEAEKVKVIIPYTIAITGIATVEAVKEGKKVKTEISAELVTTVTDEVTKQLNII